MTEETAEEAAQIVNSKRNFSINPTMAEETAEEAAQRVNAKRLAAKERKTAQLDENQHKSNLDSESQNVSKLKMIAMMIGFGILTWIRSSMPTRF